MKEPGRLLFLATDTPEVREEARRRYANRAFFQQVPVAHTGEQHGQAGSPALDDQVALATHTHTHTP